MMLGLAAEAAAEAAAAPMDDGAGTEQVAEALEEALPFFSAAWWDFLRDAAWPSILSSRRLSVSLTPSSSLCSVLYPLMMNLQAGIDSAESGTPSASSSGRSSSIESGRRVCSRI
uniref:Uncharacterized protein n=1 Tax=Ixodes ricinus TaxID=34613 RepID=A0A6B0UL63_IXORI